MRLHNVSVKRAVGGAHDKRTNRRLTRVADAGCSTCQLKLTSLVRDAIFKRDATVCGTLRLIFLHKLHLLLLLVSYSIQVSCYRFEVHTQSQVNISLI
jgi:hypothetical protein